MDSESVPEGTEITASTVVPFMLPTPPPKSWFQWGRYFRWLICGLLLAWLVSGCSLDNSIWSPAASIGLAPVIPQVMRENTLMVSANLRAFRLNTQPDLAVFDFNSAKMCGPRFCTYVGYQLGNPPIKVWTAHLNRNLPIGTALFMFVEPPCFSVSQLESATKMRRTKFCLHSGRVRAVETTVGKI